MPVVISWCRATCAGVPCGPWRFGLSAARRDLIARELGCYGEDGAFFTSVPGGIQTRHEWVSLEEEAALARSVKGGDATQHGKRLSVTNSNRRVLRIGGSRL